MTLYTQSESNIRKTWVLIALFLIFIIGLGWLFSYALDNPLILIGAVIFSLVMNVGSYWYSDKIVLAMTKAKPIEKRGAPELYRLVENLCITAGLPLPKIYILPESQPNAFATGRDKEHAVVAVTQGLLQKLDRTELEGVVAHELSHIGNKDMLLMTIVVVLVGFIAIISDWLLRVSHFGGRDSDRDSGRLGAILFIVAIIFAILAPLVGMIIQLAISRKREFLADSTGAILTRYPEGLAKALEKISADKTPLQTASTANAHLFIANPFRGKRMAGLFMTHPPIEERVRALRGMSV